MPPREIQEAMSRQMSAERNRRAVVTESEGTREAAVHDAEGNQQAADPQRRRPEAVGHPQAEGARQAAILNAEGFAMALDRIFQAASRIDEKTMGLQYLDMMKSLAGGPSTKWVIPMELTSFVQGFARNLMAASRPAAAGNGVAPAAQPRAAGARNSPRTAVPRAPLSTAFGSNAADAPTVEARIAQTGHTRAQ